MILLKLLSKVEASCILAFRVVSFMRKFQSLLAGKGQDQRTRNHVLISKNYDLKKCVEETSNLNCYMHFTLL